MLKQLSPKCKRLVRDAKNSGLPEDQVKLCLIGKGLRLDISYFPDEILDIVSEISQDEVWHIKYPDSFFNKLRNMWPTKTWLRKQGYWSYDDPDKQWEPRTSLPEFKNRMNKFLREFHMRLGVDRSAYPSEEVIEVVYKAFELYLQKNREEDYEYIGKLAKFVYTQEHSRLEEFCRTVVYGE